MKKTLRTIESKSKSRSNFNLSFYLFSFDEIRYGSIIVNTSNIKTSSSPFATQSKSKWKKTNVCSTRRFTSKLTTILNLHLDFDRFRFLHTWPWESNNEYQYEILIKANINLDSWKWRKTNVEKMIRFSFVDKPKETNIRIVTLNHSLRTQRQVIWLCKITCRCCSFGVTMRRVIKRSRLKQFSKRNEKNKRRIFIDIFKFSTWFPRQKPRLPDYHASKSLRLEKFLNKRKKKKNFDKKKTKIFDSNSHEKCTHRTIDRQKFPQWRKWEMVEWLQWLKENRFEWILLDENSQRTIQNQNTEKSFGPQE